MRACVTWLSGHVLLSGLELLAAYLAFESLSGPAVRGLAWTLGCVLVCRMFARPCMFALCACCNGFEHDLRASARACERVCARACTFAHLVLGWARRQRRRKGKTLLHLLHTLLRRAKLLLQRLLPHRCLMQHPQLVLELHPERRRMLASLAEDCLRLLLLPVHGFHQFLAAVQSQLTLRKLLAQRLDQPHTAWTRQ